MVHPHLCSYGNDATGRFANLRVSSVASRPTAKLVDLTKNAHATRRPTNNICERSIGDRESRGLGKKQLKAKIRCVSLRSAAATMTTTTTALRGGIYGNTGKIHEL